MRKESLSIDMKTHVQIMKKYIQSIYMRHVISGEAFEIILLYAEFKGIVCTTIQYIHFGP